MRVREKEETEREHVCRARRSRPSNLATASWAHLSPFPEVGDLGSRCSFCTATSFSRCPNSR